MLCSTEVRGAGSAITRSVISTKCSTLYYEHTCIAAVLLHKFLGSRLFCWSSILHLYSFLRYHSRKMSYIPSYTYALPPAITIPTTTTPRYWLIAKKQKDMELRLFARRHAFAGFTRVAPITKHIHSAEGVPSVDGGGNIAKEGDKGRGRGGGGGKDGLVATRHHAIDWNYVGQPRLRPNKWRVEMGPGGDTWREWGFAKVGSGGKRERGEKDQILAQRRQRQNLPR